MNEFAQFLRERLSKRGGQAWLAKKIGMKDGTVSKWVAGDRFPDFVSSLRIAKALTVDPAELFRMMNREEYRPLFDWITTNFGCECAPTSRNDEPFSPEHQELHRKLQVILGADFEFRITITMNIESIYLNVMTGGNNSSKKPLPPSSNSGATGAVG